MENKNRQLQQEMTINFNGAPVGKRAQFSGFREDEEELLKRGDGNCKHCFYCRTSVSRTLFLPFSSSKPGKL